MLLEKAYVTGETHTSTISVLLLMRGLQFSLHGFFLLTHNFVVLCVQKASYSVSAAPQLWPLELICQHTV